MLELRIKVGRRVMPIFDLPAAVGRQQGAREIGDQIDALIAFLDDLAGDPDIEDDDPLEADGDEQDAAWTEWQTRGRHKVDRSGAEIHHRAASWSQYGCGEDDEDDDDQDEDDDQDTGVDDEGEGIDEREADDADLGICFHYGLDQSEPLTRAVRGRVAVDDMT